MTTDPQNIEEIVLRVARRLNEEREFWAKLWVSGIKIAAGNREPAGGIKLSGDVAVTIKAFQMVHVSAFVYMKQYLDDVTMKKFAKMLWDTLLGEDVQKSIPYVNSYSKAKETCTGDKFNEQFIRFSEDVAMALTGTTTGLVYATAVTAGVLDFYCTCLGVVAHEFGDIETSNEIFNKMKKNYKI